MSTTTAGTPPGLGGQLEILRTRLSDLSGATVTIAALDDASTTEPPAEPTVVMTVVRTSIPPYVAGQAVSRLDAHVLVTAHGEHAAAADLVAGLMLRVLGTAEWEVVPGEPSVELWTALRRPPSPGFVVIVPVVLPLERWQAPLVRHPAEIHSSLIGDTVPATPRSPEPRT